MAALSCARARWCPDTGGGVARGRAQVRLKLRLAHLARPHPPAPPAMPFSFDRLAKPEKGTKWPFPKAADIQLDDVGGPETRNTLSLKELVRRLLPERTDLLAKHHTAGADACMVLEVVFALHELALPPLGKERGATAAEKGS